LIEDEFVPVRQLLGPVLRPASPRRGRAAPPGLQPRGRLLQPERGRLHLPAGLLLAAPGGPAIPAAPVRDPRARPRPPAHHGRLHPAAAAAPPRRHHPPAPRQPRRAEPRHAQPLGQLQVRRLDLLHGGGLAAGPQHQRSAHQEHAAALDRAEHQHRHQELGPHVAPLGQHLAAGEGRHRLLHRLAELVLAGLQHQLHFEQREDRQQQQLKERQLEQPAADLPLDEEGSSRTK
jgi:hypothetical protein